MSQLIKDLIAHRKSYIDCNPIFARLAGGDLTRFHYLAYLRETYHLIKHTPKYLTIAANRVAENDERLANYFRNFSREEAGHELLCIRDIHALGENADDILLKCFSLVGFNGARQKTLKPYSLIVPRHVFHGGGSQ